jgi:DNA-binding response OmpR family regulator
VYRGLSLRGLRVLVVDDDPDALDLIATILRRADAEAMQCSSPPEAPALLRSWKPHVLLSDRAEDRARSLSAGYNMHLAKPADPIELGVIVANLAGRSSAG